jgi:hypothetical protein
MGSNTSYTPSSWTASGRSCTCSRKSTCTTTKLTLRLYHQHSCPAQTRSHNHGADAHQTVSLDKEHRALVVHQQTTRVCIKKGELLPAVVESCSLKKCHTFSFPRPRKPDDINAGRLIPHGKRCDCAILGTLLWLYTPMNMPCYPGQTQPLESFVHRFQIYYIPLLVCGGECAQLALPLAPWE